MIELLTFAVGTVALALIFATLELLVRRRGISSEVTRRAAHVVAALFAILVHTIFTDWLFVAIAVAFALLMALSRRIRLLSAIHNTRRDSLGEVYLPLGAAGAAIIAGDNDMAFVAAMLVLGLADVAAGIVGDVMRAPHKTGWGSLACFVVAGLVLLACGVDWPVSLVTAVSVAITERLSLRGIDNLTIPVVAALLLVVLQA
jgi:phytol kinase